jgi:hypothetical protein
MIEAFRVVIRNLGLEAIGVLSHGATGIWPAMRVAEVGRLLEGLETHPDFKKIVGRLREDVGSGLVELELFAALASVDISFEAHRLTEGKRIDARARSGVIR